MRRIHFGDSNSSNNSSATPSKNSSSNSSTTSSSENSSSNSSNTSSRSSRVVSPFESLGGGQRYNNQYDILNDLIDDTKDIDIMDFNLSPVSHI